MRYLRPLGSSPSDVHCSAMERIADVLPVPLVDSTAAADRLRLAVAAYLARYTGSSRDHAHSDLRCFLSWCADRTLDPLAASRVHLELYIRWMQEVRRFKPSTVSRRFSQPRIEGIEHRTTDFAKLDGAQGGQYRAAEIALVSVAGRRIELGHLQVPGQKLAD